MTQHSVLRRLCDSATPSVFTSVLTSVLSSVSPGHREGLARSTNDLCIRDSILPMMTEFAASALPVAWVFADPLRFEAPPYQRAFCWSVKEGSRLLDDMLAAHDGSDGVGGEDEPDYFIGAILTVDRAPREPGAPGWPWRGAPRRFDIVDGQQRLATLTILLAVIRDLLAQSRPGMAARIAAHIRFDAAPGALAERVRLRGPDGDYLARTVQRPGACQDAPEAEADTDSEQCILDLREHFLAELGDREAASLEAFAQFVLERCTMVVIVTRNIDRAHRMFTVLNDTGKPLARNDILKAELLGQIAPEFAARTLAA